MNKTVIYQGIPGAFSHLAAKGYFSGDYEFTGVQTFHELFSKVIEGSALFAVVPIENTLAGSVYENYDLLFKYDVRAIGEYYQKVEHQLVGFRNTMDDSIQHIREVLSHPKALEQCVQFFLDNPHLKQTAFVDTAVAARFVSERKKRDVAAIASREAALIYGLEILRENIHDNPHNWTRFLIVTTTQDIKPDVRKQNEVYKSTMMFTLPHTPGSLYNALGVFAESRINLSKIESRPIHGKPFEYIFTVDFEFPPDKFSLIEQLISEFQKQVSNVKVLGVYKKAHFAIGSQGENLTYIEF